MLLRTTSTLTSDPTSRTALSRSILSLTPSPVSTSETRIRRTSSEQLLLMKMTKIKHVSKNDSTFLSLVEETYGAGEETPSFTLSTSTLGAKVAEGGRVGVSVGGGEGGGRGGAGGGSGGGKGKGEGEGEGHTSKSMDAYYQKMIKSFPEDALLLGNYARFLKEVKGDAEKSLEYCERAILAKRRSDDDDGSLLSMYGDIIWKTQRDGVRAQTYFDQALQSSPNDCFVLASYAQFLWDSGEDDEEEEEEEETEVYNK